MILTAVTTNLAVLCCFAASVFGQAEKNVKDISAGEFEVFKKSQNVRIVYFYHKGMCLDSCNWISDQQHHTVSQKLEQNSM